MRGEKIPWPCTADCLWRSFPSIYRYWILTSYNRNECDAPCQRYLNKNTSSTKCLVKPSACLCSTAGHVAGHGQIPSCTHRPCRTRRLCAVPYEKRPSMGRTVSSRTTINQRRSIRTEEYSSAIIIKKDGPLMDITSWVSFQNILLSGRSLTT